ncbi:MAG: acyl-[acyl-carrier-protein]--UDP-N-acetylglucosamine O-acyltransferase, partial [Halanaerobiales bacterium]
VEGLNYKGMKRHGLETATIDEIVRAFNILYNSGLTIDEAVEQMDQELPTSREVEDFIRFIKKSTRGICR